MNRLLFSFYFTCCATILFAQNGYNDARNQGVNAFKAGKYTEAIDHFKSGTACSDKPENNDLERWIKRCEDMVKKQSPSAKVPAASVTPTVKAASTAVVVADSIAPEEPKITDIDMVFVQGGTFTMGCVSEKSSDCYPSEVPLHEVKLSDFYIGRYEVTQAQWRAVMDTVPSKHLGDSLPVENVSWNEVQEFISKLNKLTGKQYRLPTEAEWEYAARGGNKSSNFRYSGSNEIDSVAWHDDNSRLKTHPVGGKKPNELEIYDMSGNVHEWCGDFFNFSFYQKCKAQGVVTNPKSPNFGSTRVIRGGGNTSYSWDCRVSVRSDIEPDAKDGNIGFRLVHPSSK